MALIRILENYVGFTKINCHGEIFNCTSAYVRSSQSYHAAGWKEKTPHELNVKGTTALKNMWFRETFVRYYNNSACCGNGGRNSLCTNYKDKLWLNHMKPYEPYVCVSFKQVFKVLRVLFVLKWIMFRRMLAREDGVLMGYLHLNLH